MEFRLDRRALTVTTFADDRTNRPLAYGEVVLRRSAWRLSNFCGGSSLDLAPDFDEFCALLTARACDFVIIGAHALAFHGAPRFAGIWS